MTELRRLQAPECDGAGCTGDPFEGPAAGRARSGKRSRDLERQGLDIDAADQREALRQSRRVQVVRRSTGEVVSEHESAKQVARTLGIPLGSIWRFIRKQQVKDGLFVRAAAPSALCAGDVQGGNKDREWNPTGVNEVAADCSPLGVDLPRSTNNSPADTGDGSHALACDALSEEDDCNVLHAWDQWTRTLSPGLMQSQAICMAFDERTCQMVVRLPDVQPADIRCMHLPPNQSAAHTIPIPVPGMTMLAICSIICYPGSPSWQPNSDSSWISGTTRDTSVAARSCHMLATRLRVP